MKLSRRSFREVGRFQWVLLFVFSIVGTPGNWGNVGVLFIAPKIDHWCKTNFTSLETMNSTRKADIISEWPKCRQPDTEYWLESDYNTSNVQWSKCSGIEFKKEGMIFKWTATQKYELACDREWLISIGNTVYMCGFFVSAVTSGSLADRFGRRTIALCAVFLTIVAQVLTALAPVLEVYFLGRFLAATGEMGGFTAAYIMVMEVLRKDQRILPLAFGGPLGLVIGCLLPGVATLLSSYEHFCYMLAGMLGFEFVCAYFIYPESPRWLASRNRYEEAEIIVERIAKINKKEKGELAYLYLCDEEKKFHISPLDLIRTPLLRKRTLVLWVLWLSTVFVNYGLLYNLADFGTDVRISLIFMAILDFPGWVLVVWSAEKFGRQVSLFVHMLLAGICCLLMAPLVHDKSSMVLTTLALLGKTFGGNIFFLVYQHTPELYPTVMRTMGLGASSTVARVGGMVAPLLSLLNVHWPPLLVVILGSATLISAILVPMIPDTTGLEFAQTIDEGENFLKDHKYKLVLPPDFTCSCRKREKSRENGTTEQLGAEMDSVVAKTDL